MGSIGSVLGPVVSPNILLHGLKLGKHFENEMAHNFVYTDGNRFLSRGTECTIIDEVRQQDVVTRQFWHCDFAE